MNRWSSVTKSTASWWPNSCASSNKLSNNIILEPVGRNTAPAIALAALQATRHGDDPLMLVLAADHIINNQPVFHDAIRVAEQYADEGHLVTFGIVPNAPETGYGYIQRGVALTDSAHTPYQVARFVEKPDRERAEAYLASGEYYWNSGMFMFRAKKIPFRAGQIPPGYPRSLPGPRSMPPITAATSSASRMTFSASVRTSLWTTR
ncbi:mannose-1-phosphate guanylyltransferase [Klebsiella pneumoniae subsp. pneumoniae]|nr:mannose-1-phosphate guanylyltransferase [Klebsiella pneumoniae subsp. pneumoniae]